ncbi:MAG: hypothetical protein K0R19_1387 [Bacillota bacterium]|jgi:hypothetical protein|nr:hypothetical protein [Bacillota bacterium]
MFLHIYNEILNFIIPEVLPCLLRLIMLHPQVASAPPTHIPLFAKV